MFPGYIFAKFHYPTHYRQVVHSQGITRMVELGDQRVIPDRIIQDLKASIPEGILETPDLSIEPGAEVEMVAGSL